MSRYLKTLELTCGTLKSTSFVLYSISQVKARPFFIYSSLYHLPVTFSRIFLFNIFPEFGVHFSWYIPCTTDQFKILNKPR